MNPEEKNLEDINIGDSASFERIITDEDLKKFADISGDYNPLHLDQNYAAGTEFKGRIVYGMFLGALISRLVGMELPGKKALLLKERLEFKKPARIGDKLFIKGSIIHKSEASRIIELAIEIYNGKELLASGSAYVRVLE